MSTAAAIQEILAKRNHIADRQIAMSIYLIQSLEHLLPIESTAGIEKTEVVKGMARTLYERIIHGNIDCIDAQICRFVELIRRQKIERVSRIAETLGLARTLIALHHHHLDLKDRLRDLVALHSATAIHRTLCGTNMPQPTLTESQNPIVEEWLTHFEIQS